MNRVIVEFLLGLNGIGPKSVYALEKLFQCNFEEISELDFLEKLYFFFRLFERKGFWIDNRTQVLFRYVSENNIEVTNDECEYAAKIFRILNDAKKRAELVDLISRLLPENLYFIEISFGIQVFENVQKIIIQKGQCKIYFINEEKVIDGIIFYHRNRKFLCITTLDSYTWHNVISNSFIKQSTLDKLQDMLGCRDETTLREFYALLMDFFKDFNIKSLSDLSERTVQFKVSSYGSQNSWSSWNKNTIGTIIYKMLLNPKIISMLENTIAQISWSFDDKFGMFRSPLQLKQAIIESIIIEQHSTSITYTTGEDSFTGDIPVFAFWL